MTMINDDDLDEVLQRAFPQGYTMLRLEDGTELLRHSARALLESPRLARAVLGAKTAGKLGRAAIALGNRYVKCGERIVELADAPSPALPPTKAGEPEKQHSRSPAEIDQ